MGYAEITKPESEYTVHKTKENGISINVALISLYFFLSPMEDILNVGFGTILKYLAIIIFIFVLSTYYREIKVDFFIKCSLYFIVLAWFSVAWSINKDTTISRNVAYTLLPAFFCVVYITDFSDTEKAFLDGAIILGGLATAAYIFASHGIGSTLVDRLTISEDSDPNGLAGRLLLSLTVSVKQFVKSKNIKWRILGAVSAAAILFVCLGTSSRGAVVSIAAMLLTLLMFVHARTKVKIILIIVAIILIIPKIATDFLPVELYSRIFSIENYLRETGEMGARYRIWEYCIVDILPKSGIFGLGAGCSPVALLPYMGYASGVHNLYLNMLLEFGILGIPVFIVFIWKLFAVCIKNQNIFALGALVGVLVCSFFLDTYANKFLWNAMAYCLIGNLSLQT